MARRRGTRPTGGPYQGHNSYQDPSKHRKQSAAARRKASSAEVNQFGAGLEGVVSLQEIIGTSQPTLSDIKGAGKRVGQQTSPQGARARRLESEEIEAEKTVARVSGVDGLLLPYQPTSTINPNRPRTHAAGYDYSTGTLMVRFDRPTKTNPTGAWEYHGVPERVWSAFQRVKSPGRYINTMLNHFDNGPGDF